MGTNLTGGSGIMLGWVELGMWRKLFLDLIQEPRQRGTYGRMDAAIFIDGKAILLLPTEFLGANSQPFPQIHYFYGGGTCVELV